MSTAALTGISREEELHWLALKLVPGIGTRKLWQLAEQFRTPQAVFRASRSELEAAGLPGSVAQSVVSGCSFEDAVGQQQKMLDLGVELIAAASPLYPALLRDIYDPPAVLFARGRTELLKSEMLGVVGTRRPTHYGTSVAEKFSADLAQAGLTIVSGMARGIDTAAHKGVLGVGGDTVAVLGCGVDIVYPAENRALAKDIAAKGLLLSEFPMEAPAYPQNFPIRNRVISGMSVGVMVVEGAQYSGSAITARLALDFQREVFAIPGNITSRASWGPNLLIKQGAKLVQDWNDVLVDLPPAVRRKLIQKAQGRQGVLGLDAAEAAPEGGPELGPCSREILKWLKVDTPIHLDTLIETFEHVSSSEIIAGLFELEIQGLARQLPGKNFVKVW